MTQKISFSKKWDYLVSVVFDNTFVPDVLLMIELRFTPHSWKVWKSKFIERSKYGTQKRIRYTTKKEVIFKIIYDKKHKMWSYEETSPTE